MAALTILQEGHITLKDFNGSWAGAMGQSQFIPTSFLQYAVDYDGDGRKDIWGTPADVFASIANFLASEGWQDDQTWGRQVSVSGDFDFTLAGLDRAKFKPLSFWQEQGVRRFNGNDLPQVDINASLIMPDGKKWPHIPGLSKLSYANEVEPVELLWCVCELPFRAHQTRGIICINIPV